MANVMQMAVPPDFNLGKTVCSYGYFSLAPNRWEPPRGSSGRGGGGSLWTRVRDAAGNVVAVRVTQPSPGGPLRLQCQPAVSGDDRHAVRAAIRRMLRVDEDLSPWWALHERAAAERWGRLFRSGTLFEDIARTMTSCNIGWKQTVRMNARLCEHVGRGAFPEPEDLARCDEATLKTRCGTGYRASWLIELGRSVADGRLDITWFEHPTRETAELYHALREVRGVGDYAARNILQHLGRYERVAVDSELLRHFREHHQIDGTLAQVTRAAEAYYQQYHPYQFLAYWWELWRGYEQQHGPARQWVDVW